MKIKNNTGYDDVDECKEGLFRVRKNDQYGFIDESGKLVIDFQYDYGYSFLDGLAYVKLNKKWITINKAGEKVERIKNLI